MDHDIEVRNLSLLYELASDQLLPRVTLRELVMNGIEASYAAGGGEVRVQVAFVDGIPKLAVWNDCLGFGPEQLRSNMDLFSSGVEKMTGLDGNFGIGGKLASLKFSPYGVRFRVCQNVGGEHVVHECILYLDLTGGSPVIRFRREEDDSGELLEVYDATEAAKVDGLPLDRAWHEVVLLGTAPNHNTAAELCEDMIAANADPKQSAWVLQALWHRFWMWAEAAGAVAAAHPSAKVRVMVDPKLSGHKVSGKMPVRPIGEVLAAKGKGFRHIDVVTLAKPVELETGVVAPAGTRLVYALAEEDKFGHNKAVSPTGFMPRRTFGGIVARGEIFDPQVAGWPMNVTQFGVHAEHSRVYLFALVPTEAAREDMMRSRVTLIGDATKTPLRLRDFRRAFIEHQPKWLAALNAKAMEGEGDDKAKRDHGFWKKLYSPAGDKLGKAAGGAGDFPAGGLTPDNVVQFKTSPGSEPKQTPVKKAKKPQISKPEGGKPSKGPEEIRVSIVNGGGMDSDGFMAGVGVTFSTGDLLLTVNRDYEGFRLMIETLLATHPKLTEAGAWCGFDRMVRSDMLAVIYVALSKKRKPWGWAGKKVEEVLSDAALTVAFENAAPYVRRASISGVVTDWNKEAVKIKPEPEPELDDAVDQSDSTDLSTQESA